MSSKIITIILYLVININLNYQTIANNILPINGEDYRVSQKISHPSNNRSFNNLRALPPISSSLQRSSSSKRVPPKSSSFFSRFNFWDAFKVHRPQSSPAPSTLEKRFLSTETKQSMGDVSVASNSFIHDNYVSQQFKWSNR